MACAPAYGIPVVPGSPPVVSPLVITSATKFRNTACRLTCRLKSPTVSTLLKIILVHLPEHNSKSFWNIRHVLASIIPCSISHHLMIRLSIGQTVVLLRGRLVLRPRETCQTTRSYNSSYLRRQIAGDTACWTEQVLVSPMYLQLQI